tara:strand:+ start:839 stop:1306 length:468 start_codon:yes stop_codon:yes gene_type:complete
MAITFIVALVVFITDFCLKTYLRLNFGESSLPVIENVFHITLVYNKGAAFGILQGQTTLLIAIAVVFLIIFVKYISLEATNKALFFVSYGLILGGAISNLCDRIFLGYVIDYLDFRIWPVFNISDTCITLGAGCLLFQSMNWKFTKKKPDRSSGL